MKILGLDSSGLTASVAIQIEGKLAAEYTVNNKKTHSQTLLPMIDEIMRSEGMDPKDLDGIAISAGPGSFTGLRIGSATAKGLGLALDIPLVNVPTLEGMAFNLSGSDKLICPIMDARRNQVYTGVYDVSGERPVPVKEQCAIDVAELVDCLNEMGRDVVFLGDGVPVYKGVIQEKIKVGYSFAAPGNDRQRAASVCALAGIKAQAGETESADEHRPEYLRASQAERERSERLKSG